MQRKKTRKGGSAPDLRVEKSKATVLRTAYELLTKSGLSGVSVDEISRRSGVAKTTIYRHWPTREALMLDACSQLNPRPAVPDTGNIKFDLEQLVCRVALRFREPWATVMPSIIDAAERDKDLAALQARIHAQMREAFVIVIERAQDRGQVSRSYDAKELVAGLLGPVLYRRFFSREPLDEAFAKKVVSRLLHSINGDRHIGDK